MDTSPQTHWLPPAENALAQLTEGERHVAAGKSNSEIAAALYLSVATVKTHVSRLLEKLDRRDRAPLVLVAYETGAVIPGPPSP